ncbi:MAG: hypothetical protein A2X12_01480 [Bacteroidetes bacterium GWE2_29_8]|nr:MAG: hypothetical protein A2X12_01480 [Bacteroidetes bacterium GWE2_29_8]OFY23381.1 MAG: hypothetical protein A2X02_08755 [Bacteroidetes bacterium GWF2_29_10]
MEQIKINCWEYKKCGRQVGGDKVSELGVCPAATEIIVDGINCGKNGGRACWAVTGTYCKGEIQGSFAQKVINCLNCDFYKIVWKEEQENDYKSPKEILQIIRGK